MSKDYHPTDVPTPMTVEASARLNPVWRDMLIDDLSGMVLLASIHPDNNRPEGDEDVVARALMFRPDGELGRLTIRSGMLRMADETFVDDLGGTCSDATPWATLKLLQSYSCLAIETLHAVMKLPVITLPSAKNGNPVRADRTRENACTGL